jgi:hypothetical protein
MEGTIGGKSAQIKLLITRGLFEHEIDKFIVFIWLPAEEEQPVQANVLAVTIANSSKTCARLFVFI